VPRIICAEVIAFVLYGHQYAFSLELSFFFALAATVYVLRYTRRAASVGASGAKMSTVCNVLALLVLIGLDVVLIPRIGIPGAAITLRI